MGRLEDQTETTPVAGVVLQRLGEIATEGGPVLHFLRADYPLMPVFPGGFGEIYFSEVRYGCIKAWKRHRKQQQTFVVPRGLMQIVLFDDRTGSETRGTVYACLLGRPGHYSLLRVPNGLWYGFRAVSEDGALLCNCADIPHSPEESERLPLVNQVIPYTWTAPEAL